MRDELLGARYSRWLNRAGKPWSVRKYGLHSKGVSVGEAGSTAYYISSCAALISIHYATLQYFLTPGQTNDISMAYF